MKKLALLILLAIVVVSLFIWSGLRPVDAGNAEEIAVTVEKGDSLGVIASKLEKLDLIRSEFSFKTFARLTGVASSLQAGTFPLSKSMSVGEILDTIHEGKTKEMFITIPEGYSVKDIDALLASKGLGKPGDILDCAFTCDFSSFEFLPKNVSGSREKGIGSKLEGYLFPETYGANIAEYVPKFFLERLLGEFRERIAQGHADDLKASGHTLHEVVTMASLVEEESRHDEERAVVAGILWKRLENGVVLGVDAVNRYGLGKKTEPLTSAELEADSPYNSRRRQGLPPSPIASPGESAIVATMKPKQSQYWYYLHGTDGVIHYAVTDAEHVENKRKYLR